MACPSGTRWGALPLGASGSLWPKRTQVQLMFETLDENETSGFFILNSFCIVSFSLYVSKERKENSKGNPVLTTVNSML